MNAKHTPGPWHLTKWEDFGSTRFYISQEDGAEYTPNYSDVSFSTCDGEHIDIQEANARLISAAPELLEVAQSILADDMIQYLPVEYINKVKSVIEKATGGN